MEWMALACTAENEVLAWSDDLATLESACADEFRAICRVYGVEDIQAQQLRNFNSDFKVQFDGPRNTVLVPFRKDPTTKGLGQILQMKVGLIKELEQRLAHGFKRFNPTTNWQLEAYREKYQQALLVQKNESASDIGMVEDYAEEAGVSLAVAAGIIVNKYENRVALIRKLERLRIRHQIAIRKATTREELNGIRAAMDEDSFISMLM